MEELLKRLYAETVVEDLQKKTGKNINTMNLNYHRSIVPEIPQADFFKYGNIAVNKHARFSYTPAHTHSFIEINYVLNGQCTQRLNGEKFLLKKDQLVILDRKVIQQIDHVGSDDILINILLDKESIQNEIIPNLPASRNLVTDFSFMLLTLKMNTTIIFFWMHPKTNYQRSSFLPFYSLAIIEPMGIKGF